MDVTSIDDRHYRIKEPTLLKILKGEIQTLLVAYTYDRYHLVCELPKTYLKRSKLKKHESKCTNCNGHGMIGWMICSHCKGTTKINWIQNVFEK